MLQCSWVLCIVLDQLLVVLIVVYLGLFEQVIVSDGQCNLFGFNKVQVLVDVFGECGFDYVGNGMVDLVVWVCVVGVWVVNNGSVLVGVVV